MAPVLCGSASPYRNGLQILRACGAYAELSATLEGIRLAEAQALREGRQRRADQRAKDKGEGPGAPASSRT